MHGTSVKQRSVVSAVGMTALEQNGSRNRMVPGTEWFQEQNGSRNTIIHITISNVLEYSGTVVLTVAE